MGLWQRLFRNPPTPEPVETTEDDQLERHLVLLAEHGFTPRGAVEVDDNDAYRRRPLTTLLTSTADGRPLFPRVFIDADELSRTTAVALPGFVLAAAEHAGTGAEVHGVRVMCDPKSTSTGSLRLTRGWDVVDHSFDLGEAGDEVVEDAILQSVAPQGHDAFTFYAQPDLTPVTLWLGSGTDDSLIDALLAENAEVAEAAEA
ncbi:hypothetical protein [Corynebacterium sp.]|uniref:hypothetical protein n=1 Tax=Corynebacterium sp. TaxID=1720 RepID=UPI0026DF8B2D|nr:hypothetical protein [Corynebacterium sp.]MDO5511399.1 hypothetical protein [Corynebacterium sp.]